MMRDWPEVSKARVEHMTSGDFYGSEQAVTIGQDGTAVIEYVTREGRATVLKSGIPLTAGEISDCAVMNVRELREFYKEEMEKAKADDVLLSLHIKSTMMRVSDPIIFGHCVSVYYQDVLEKHSPEMGELGVNPDNGIAELYTKLEALTDEKRAEIESDISDVYNVRPKLMMVNSDRGITNFHVPSDVIIDATMPVMIRDGGKTWGPDNELHDTVAMIPDRSYATLYQAVIDDCKEHGAFDPATLGSVSNVGLMAQKAEEYGSHDKTFKAPGNGTIRVVDSAGTTLMEQLVEEGDIFRMCQTKDEPIQDWVKLGVTRARLTGSPSRFWVDPNRAHDAEVIKKVELNEFMIAYEPVWAIGSGTTANLDYIDKIHTEIIDEVSSYQKEGFLGVSYGGSVDSSSSKDILSIKGVEGLLIGGASLQYQEFCNIVLSNN